ncbi:hypothetical protein MCOR27_005994 [Pyricularia oryzae]|nr:hypothetical protein MCOR19_004941 [Pyricularia oryzae]KAI6277430.1 hypothetical protein MCOR27_005994 [Pyricularia oryzae]KAI6285045.1 hypothetical protein MCOR34_010966 [Pyricularia oryzae]KAI6468256.1 hypothetical protein MCOR15_002242 [Pyricularia oryzae]KAI6521865.1 hypothetical protein MCOR16_007746 [Pyricularia oryzae]
MVKVDSVLRESARLNTLVCLSGTRLVLAPEGLELPNGMTVPQGTPISFQAAPIMENEDIYPRANEFQPFRFVPKAKNDKADAQEESRARTAFACTSPTYMAFGHGKHACIGRFFASAELKLMLAHIVLHYELEKIERPLGKWYGMVRVPPMTAKLKIRTRRHMEV